MTRILTRRDFLKVSGAGLAGAALFGVAGCGEADETGQNGNEQVTLTWWDSRTDEGPSRIEQDRLESYMEDNPNVTIERRAIPFEALNRTLLQGASTGDLPDIAMIDNPDHQSFAALGALEDLTDRTESWEQADAYFEGPWASTMFEGRNYGFPGDSNCLALFYNKDLLEQAGIEPPATWNELRAAARALTEGNRFGLVVSAIADETASFQWLPFLWQSGEDIPTIDSQGGRSALQLWVDMVEEGIMSRGILGWDQTDINEQFQNEQAAMMINGPWQIPALRESVPDLNWEVALLPKGEASASILGGHNLAVTTASENVDAAWDLLTWMQEPDITLKEYLLEADRLPTREDMADESEWQDDPALSVFVEQLEVGRPRAYGPNYPEISAAIQRAVQAAVSGESSVEAALAEAQETITPLLPED